MATATNGSSVIKPDHAAGRKHFIFSQEHEDLRESMQSWVQKELWPHRNEWEDTYWPTSAMQRAGELGFLGLCFPEEYGGQGGDYFYSLVRAECMSYSGSGGTNMGFAVQTDMVLPPIHLLGTEEQKEKYLKPGLKGEKVGSLGITEPGAGSDVAGIRTTALLDGDEYIINGSKTFITNGPRADFIVLVCKTDPDERHAGITLFVVDLRDENGETVPGFTVSAELEKMGMHASDTGELAFEDVRVPASAVLGEVGKGFYHIAWELQGERLVAAAGCHAGAERMIEKTIEYAKEREAFGRPIGKFQGMRWKLATMYHDIEAGRGLLYRACATADPFPDPLLAATAKVYCNEMSVRVTSDALQVFGGYGFTDEYLVSRLYRGARYGSLGGGTSETLRDLIGKRLMEADAPDGIFGLSDF